MAERTATRASTRLITPQSSLKIEQATNKPQQTAARRSTRAARSQSRDVSDSEATKTSGKGGLRGTRQPNATGAEVPGKPGRKGKNTAQPNSDRSKSLVIDAVSKLVHVLGGTTIAFLFGFIFHHV